MSKRNLEEVLKHFNALVREMYRRYQVQVDKPDLGRVLDEVERLRKREAVLLAAWDDYGNHTADCSCRVDPMTCNCGFLQVQSEIHGVASTGGEK